MYKIVLILVTTLALSACKNWKVEPATSGIWFVNASPGIEQANFLLNGQQILAQPLLYDTTTNTYVTLQAGKRDLSAVVPGSTSPIFIKPVFLIEFVNYSAFLTKKFVGNDLKDTLIVYPDTLRVPAAGRARIRFVNLFAEKGSTLDLLSVAPNIVGDTLFANRHFPGISNFVEISTSPQYTFTLHKNGKFVKNVSLSRTIAAQNSYTIIALDSLGSAGSTEKKLKLRIIQHN